MSAHAPSQSSVVRCAALLICLAISRPVLAQDALAAQPGLKAGQGTISLQSYRAQFDALMVDFERIAKAQGDTAGVAQARRAREVMKTLSDQQLAAVYERTRVPDLSVLTMASAYAASKAGVRQGPSIAVPGTQSLAGFPGPVDIPAGCNGVDITADTRYALLIIKEVANSILAAAAWVCNEDILGENGSAACIPLAIAADIANGFFDTATFCAGEVTANQVDANFNRLDHLHNDLASAITTIVGNSNANTTSIIANDNTNATAIVTNDNTNTATILANANANKNELRDLILRTQIEADLAMSDSAAVVSLYQIPNAQGGYLDLVQRIVTETITRIAASGGSVGNAQSILGSADAAKAAGDFKAAYSLYRKAYKAAGK